MCDMEVRTRKSTVASYLAGVFLSFLALRVLLGNPMVGLVLDCFREFALYGGMGSMGWLLGGLLCVIRANG